MDIGGKGSVGVGFSALINIEKRSIRFRANLAREIFEVANVRTNKDRLGTSEFKSLHLMADLLKLRFAQLRQHGLNRRRGLNPGLEDWVDRLLAAGLLQGVESGRIACDLGRNLDSDFWLRERDRVGGGNRQ